MYDNEYYGAPNDYRNYLSHHGIKGQKWGVMHGPPYPLGSHTSAMIKKGKKVAAKAKNTYDKKIKHKVNDLTKKAAKKTKEVYEVNKEIAKKSNNMIAQQHMQNDITQQMMRMHNDITQQHIQHIQQIHTYSMMFGKDVPKEDIKEPLDRSKMTEWEKKTIKGGYVVNNPSGFEEGTKYKHIEYDKRTSDTWTIEDKESRISIDKITWDEPIPILPGHEPKNQKELSKKEISNLQRSLIKNKKAIFSDVANNMAVEMLDVQKSYPQEFPEKYNKKQIVSMIMNDPTFTPSIRAMPTSYNGKVDMEVTLGDGGIWDYHLLTKEVYFDLKTGKWKVSNIGIQMDG